jgi:hypothetical protein
VIQGEDLKGEIKGATPHSPKAVAFKLLSTETKGAVGDYQGFTRTFPLFWNC